MSKACFIILESSDKNSSENKYLQSLQEKNYLNNEPLNMNILKNSSIYRFDNYSHTNDFKNNLKNRLEINDSFNWFQFVYILVDNDTEFGKKVQKDKEEIKNILMEDVFKSKLLADKNIFYLLPKPEGTFEEFLVLHIRPKIMKKKDALYFLSQTLKYKDSAQFKKNIDQFIDKTMVGHNDFPSFMKQVQENCNKMDSNYKFLFNQTRNK